MATTTIPGIPSIAVQAPAARLGVAVVRQLVDVIVTGVLAPGELLPPELPLTTQFGVSRTVIRESVKRLEEKGLVTVSQGRGTTVNPPSSWNLLDPVVLQAMIDHDDSLGILDELSEVRVGLESPMAGHAAEHADAESLAELQAAFDRMRAAVDDPTTFPQLDVAFHILVMEMSGSRLAQSIARTLFEHALVSNRYRGRDPERAFEITVDEHARILDAILAGDAAGAEAAMHAHIADSWARRRLPVHGRDD